MLLGHGAIRRSHPLCEKCGSSVARSLIRTKQTRSSASGRPFRSSRRGGTRQKRMRRPTRSRPLLSAPSRSESCRRESHLSKHNHASARGIIRNLGCAGGVPAVGRRRDAFATPCAGGTQGGTSEAAGGTPGGTSPTSESIQSQAHRLRTSAGRQAVPTSAHLLAMCCSEPYGRRCRSCGI